MTATISSVVISSFVFAAIGPCNWFSFSSFPSVGMLSYAMLAGYPASLGTLPPIRPSLPPFLPPSRPPLPFSLPASLQSAPRSFHPRITRLRCVIVQDNCFPESYFEILTSKIPHRGVNFFIDLSTVCVGVARTCACVLSYQHFNISVALCIPECVMCGRTRNIALMLSIQGSAARLHSLE